MWAATATPDGQSNTTALESLPDMASNSYGGATTKLTTALVNPHQPSTGNPVPVTLDQCAEGCTTHGTKFFAVTGYGSECWCAN